MLICTFLSLSHSSREKSLSSICLCSFIYTIVLVAGTCMTALVYKCKHLLFKSYYYFFYLLFLLLYILSIFSFRRSSGENTQNACLYVLQHDNNYICYRWCVHQSKPFSLIFMQFASFYCAQKKHSCCMSFTLDS